jgi:hypothetical protein
MKCVENYKLYVLFLLSQICLGGLSNGAAPRYNLHNMPRTSFTCRDKILGGYYADPETNCQMFHVCVKVAGIGIQNFRFLCPNGTAFDQEAQICADWGDVDCEAATIYYGSNNFDLYRIGSTVDNKASNFNEEDEVFRLQQAETSDARRSKQYIINQNKQTYQQQIYSHTTRSTTTTPTSTTTRTTTTTTTPATTTIFTTTTTPIPRTTTTTTLRTTENSRHFKTDVSKFQKTDDFRSTPTVTQYNTPQYYNTEKKGRTEDVNQEYYRTSIKPKQRTHYRGRSKFRNSKVLEATKPPRTKPTDVTYSKPYQQSTTYSTTTTTTTTRIPFKINYPDSSNFISSERPFETPIQATSRFDRYQTEPHQFVPTTIAPITTNNHNNQQHFERQLPASRANAIPQRVIVPNNFNQPKRLESTTLSTTTVTYITPTIPFIRDQPKTNSPPIETKTKLQRVTQKFNFETQKYETVPAGDNGLINYNENQFNEYLNKDKNGKPIYPSNQSLKTAYTPEFIKPSTYNPKNYQAQQQQTTQPQTTTTRKVSTRMQQVSEPVKKLPQPPFFEEPKFLEKTRTEPKRFSTLVPRESYNATTLKPFVNFNAIENQRFFVPTTTVRPFVEERPAPIRTVTTSTVKPLADGEEDDGQYRPELYEKDFYRNRKVTAKTTKTIPTSRRNPFEITSRTTQKVAVVYNSGEDELLKTENSQNIAASNNELRLNQEKEKQKQFYKLDDSFDVKSSPRPFSRPEEVTRSTKLIVTRPATKPSTKKPTAKPTDNVDDKDVSYDYAYYDTQDEQYPEYSVIEDFSKTSRKTKTKF